MRRLLFKLFVMVVALVGLTALYLLWLLSTPTAIKQGSTLTAKQGSTLTAIINKRSFTVTALSKSGSTSFANPKPQQFVPCF